MATDTFQQNTKTAVKTSVGPLDMLQAILAPLASLKLTVCLLFLAVLVTFIATLDQTLADVYAVKMKHFSRMFVEVPFQTFFVPAWFPDRQNIPGSFFLPSGLTILVLMIINLSAAHLLRFKLHARGGRLILGILIALFAAFMTWAIVFNGPNANGFQGEPPISWEKMWTMLQIGVLGIGVASGIGLFTLDKKRVAEKMLLAIGTLVCIAVLILTLFLKEKAFIGDSAMRILWQLIQATIAGLVAYLACMILFKRKAGIVLVHLGIAGLMFNEIYVTVTNDEQRMTIFEGQTVSTAVDIRHTEMAIIDISDSEFDNVTTIPGQKLKPNELISDEKLPFDVLCIRYMTNSDIRSVGPKTENLADAGIGTRLEAVEIQSGTGTDSDQAVDFGSAYVEILEKPTARSLGTYLISQNLDEAKSDAIKIGDKSYHIALRFKTAYKPYSMTLKEAQQENYLGTMIPRWYSSDVVLNDFTNDISSDQKIYMNNPLRYSGETFYQSGMDTLDDGRQYTVLQVVKNHGWMIPYVCCMFTVVGLIAQFGVSLLAFLEKQQSLVPETAAALATPPIERPLIHWVPTILFAGFLGLWGIGEAVKSLSPKVVNEKLDLTLFGQLPVTINGRVQPLDSVARNTARQLSKREGVVDGESEKQDAIRWLADTLFEAEGYDEYYLFRIEDDKVIAALELPEIRKSDPSSAKRFRFTLGELLRSEEKLRSMIPDSDKKPAEEWDSFEKRLNSVGGMIQRIYGVKFAFGRPEIPNNDILLRLETAGRTMSSPLIPLAIPTSDDKAPWLSMMSLQDRAWLNDLAKAYKKDTTSELARAIIEKEILPELREETIRERIIQRLLSDPEFVKAMDQQYNETDPRVLSQTMLKNWDKFPEKIKTNLVAAEGPLVDAMIAQQMPRYEGVLETQIAAVNGSKGKINSDDLEIVTLLNELRPAYLTKDAEKFNSTLNAHLAKVETINPVGLKKPGVKTNFNRPFTLLDVASLFAFALILVSPLILAFLPKKKWKLASIAIVFFAIAAGACRYFVQGGLLPFSIMPAERFYNSFSPFYIASLFYLIAMVVAGFSWIGLDLILLSTFGVRAPKKVREKLRFDSMNQAAIVLLHIGLVIQIVGLILRVIISGRPPVTNLYSSVLFVSAAFVFICLIKERITKQGIGSFVAGLGGFTALLWAWTMTIASGDTFTVMVAVLDTQFWLATHVVCISIGYAATFAAGLMGALFIVNSLMTRKFVDKSERRLFINVMYGVVCFGLLCSFFGTVLGGLWGDDSWGRFWGWDPKENGALMIVLWNAIVLHARWGGMVRERGLAALAVLGNVVVLWSWKGVNELGVGLHAYAGTEDMVTKYILMTGIGHCLLAALVVVMPAMTWRSYSQDREKQPA